jgi:hypothetical protein
LVVTWSLWRHARAGVQVANPDFEADQNPGGGKHKKFYVNINNFMQVKSTWSVG